MLDNDIDDYQQSLQRICKECGKKYNIREFLETSPSYFSRPFAYRTGCERYCLACWLGVGPNDFPDDYDGGQRISEAISTVHEKLSNEDVQAREIEDDWPYESVCESLLAGDLLLAFQWFFDNGMNLAVMPIARLRVEYPIVFPGGITFYPPYSLKLSQLNLIQNQDTTNSLAEISSAASGITREVLQRHSLVVFPCRFDWQTFRHSSHKAHLNFIRDLSDGIDRCCLNFVRYQLCRLDRMHDLPAHVGQISNNHMMAGALLYTNKLHEARIIGGDAFTHYLTRGLGLTLNQLEWDSLPQSGGTGKIVLHALSLYTSLLESENLTARFMQSLSLLDFLAYPDEYQAFKKAKKIIARYATRDQMEYERILDRFIELTAKKDPNTEEIVGFRTRVVHMGERIESIVPDPLDREQLFLELDGYIRPVIDHMIEHSGMSYEEYLKVRCTLGPKNVSR